MTEAEKVPREKSHEIVAGGVGCRSCADGLVSMLDLLTMLA